MKVSKLLTINLGQYQSLRIGVDDAPTFNDADNCIISELERLKLPVNSKIKQCLQWESDDADGGGLSAWQ